jgi:transcription-repair coupling factor (superfamily II helicase)
LPDLEVFRPLGVRAPEPAVAEVQRREFLQQMHRWCRGGLEVHVFCNNAGEQDRFGEIWAEQGWGGGGLGVHVGALGRGFLAEDSGFVVVTDAEIFGRYKVLRPRRVHGVQAARTRSLLDVDFSEFESGDYVVHLEHGIGRYQGLEVSPATPGHRGGVGRSGQECLVIEYAAGRPGDTAPRLYVPVSEAHLVSKYVGAGKARPPLNVLGGARWAKARKDAERAVADLAADLLEIQAARETEAGHGFGLDTAWQREFEASFVYEETVDQARAIEATKEDMERARPMDRLICGDVGFGKTEVAIRAAFKAVMGGRQVAVLVPTTVLAQQHYQTFRERMSDYPVQVELLSRYRSKKEQRQVLERLASGSVDIVIGTHRLVQKDVEFKELGLVVIDEEQRFGVAHKERFKRLRRTVDVLTLSATPIPRTLYMALSGARDMSTIETPPQDRLPIETVVSSYDERLIRDAIRREMGRQGQVFFLHNRVGTIETMALKVRALVPEARVVMGHGQMDPDALEEVMTRFVSGEADVLVSTTIVESGLDIPNANTIIIDRADRFGLAELYQLRGRVGRYKHQAYAYLMLPRHAQLLTEARKRIAAIRQYSSLGSGFKIAMRDLEIRGAGNLLGPQQSGHITAVGFDLYCQLLKQSIASLKGEPVTPRVEVEVRLDFLALNAVEERGRGAGDGRVVAGLPESYVPESAQRVDLHRRLAQVSGLGELRKLEAELKDRFGPPPPAVQRLLQVSELRLFAWALGVTAIEVREDQLRLTRGGDYVQVGGRFPRLTKRDAKGRLNEIRRFLGMLTPG